MKKHLSRVVTLLVVAGLMLSGCAIGIVPPLAPVIAPAVAPAVQAVVTFVTLTIALVGGVIAVVFPTDSPPAALPTGAEVMELQLANPTFTFAAAGGLTVLWDTSVTSPAYPAEGVEQAARVTITRAGCEGQVSAELFVSGGWRRFPMGDMPFKVIPDECKDPGATEVDHRIVLMALSQAISEGRDVLAKIITAIVDAWPK